MKSRQALRYQLLKLYFFYLTIDGIKRLASLLRIGIQPQGLLIIGSGKGQITACFMLFAGGNQRCYRFNRLCSLKAAPGDRDGGINH